MCSCCCHELRPSARPRASRARRILPFISPAAPTATCVCARRCGVQVSPSMLSSLCADLYGSCCTVLAAPTTGSVSASGGAQGPSPTKRTALRRWHPRVGSRAGARPTCGTRCARTPSLIRVGLETVEVRHRPTSTTRISRRLAPRARRTCVPQHRSRHKRHIPRDLSHLGVDPARPHGNRYPMVLYCSQRSRSIHYSNISRVER